MITLPDVTLLQIGESFEDDYAFLRSTQAVEFFDTVRLPAMPTYAEYNRFMIHDLIKHFSTSHVLVQQSDGYIIRPECWTSAFLEWDYIGAVMWNGRVGNGGFSLRSRKFCEATAAIDLSVRDFDALRRAGVTESAFENEDARLLFEYHVASRMDIATCTVADRFSWELSDLRPTPLHTFGFHGKHTMVRMKALNIGNL